jgi:hypothetical protein
MLFAKIGLLLNVGKWLRTCKMLSMFLLLHLIPKTMVTIEIDDKSLQANKE